MNHRYFLLLFALFGFTVHASAGMGKIRSSILRPATITFPARINKIILAERGCGNCLSLTNGKRIYNGPDTSRDTQLGYLRAQLQRMNRYEISMGEVDTSMIAREKNQLLPALDWEEVGRLTNYDSTAVLIVLEEMDVAFRGDYQYEHRVWRIYDYRTRTLLDEFNHNYEFERVVRMERRTVYMPSLALQIYAHRIMPHWEEVIRTYYDKGNDRLKAAAVCLQTLDWNAAITHWQAAVADSARNRMLSAKACYNMAVYYELAGDFVTAQQWIARAIRWNVSGAEEYAAIIAFRIAEAPIVNEQVARKQGQMPVPDKDYRQNKAWTNQQPRVSRHNDRPEPASRKHDAYK